MVPNEIPCGLLFGYIRLKGKNIIPSSIFHLFHNWSTLLWQILLLDEKI